MLAGTLALKMSRSTRGQTWGPVKAEWEANIYSSSPAGSGSSLAIRTYHAGTHWLEESSKQAAFEAKEVP